MALYEFRDTIDHTPLEKKLPKEALNFNGFFLENRIDGYRTISVGGRELFANEATIDNVGTRNGGKYRRSRLPIRTIEVTYYLECETAEKFRESFNKMNQLLASHEVQIWFNDEPDKYYIATRSEVESVPQGLNNIVSSFSLVCADPYKYARTEKVVDLNSQAFKVLSNPVDDTFSGVTQYCFNLASLPLNIAKDSSFQTSDGIVAWGETRAARFILQDNSLKVGTKYVVEFDMSFPTQASVIVKSGLAANGGTTSGEILYPQETLVTNPTGQHVKYEFTPTSLTNSANIFVVATDSVNSQVEIRNFTLTTLEREFWYPNYGDTFTGRLQDGSSVNANQYPFTQEMYDIVNTDQGTLTFGTGTAATAIRVIHNIISTFYNIFPEEMENMTTAERIAYVKTMAGRVYQKALIKGSGKVHTTDFTAPELKYLETVVSGNQIINPTAGFVAYSIAYAPGIVKQGAIQIGAYSVALSNGKTLVLDNEGSVATPVSFHVENTSDNGFVSFQGSKDNGAILVGNPDEVDGVGYTQNERLIFDSFDTGKEAAWTYGNAYILRGGSKGPLPIDDYLDRTDTMNLLYLSNQFNDMTALSGATIATMTRNQTLTVGSETLNDATRYVTSGGTDYFKLTTISTEKAKETNKLIQNQIYSASIYIKNNGTQPISVRMFPGRAAQNVPAGSSLLIKEENYLAGADNIFRFEFRTANLSDNIDITIAHSVLNRGTKVLPWRSNYQDGFIKTSGFAHWYMPVQLGTPGIIKFQSDKVLYNKKRSVAFVTSWDSFPVMWGPWVGIGMRRALPADSNGVIGARNFDSRFYAGSYQADVKHRGLLEFTLDDGGPRATTDPLASVLFWKGSGQDYTEISFWIRDKRVYQIKDKKFNDFTGEVKIRKEEGGKFTFILHKSEQFGPTKTNNVSAQFTYTEGSEASTLVKGMNIYFARNGDPKTIPVNNYVHEAQITKVNVDKYVDTPNVFATGDICDILSTEYLVQTFVNNSMNLQIQDVGSQPIMLPLGLSQVYVDYSQFADSDIKIQARFRERWL